MSVYVCVSVCVSECIGDKSDQTEEKPVRGWRLLSENKKKEKYNDPDTDELRLHPYEHKSLCVIIIFFTGTYFFYFFFFLFHYARLYYLCMSHPLTE